MSIKLLFMDVDGTLTDGRLYIGSNGEIMKSFDVKDGYAIAHLRLHGIEPVIITGRKSAIVEARSKELKITELYQGVDNKLEKLKEVAQKYNASRDELAYIGDDLNDLECIEYCGTSACPADAVDEVKQKVSYICAHDGGRGAVREFIERLVKEC